jgi:hypothetical protein
MGWRSPSGPLDPAPARRTSGRNNQPATHVNDRIAMLHPNVPPVRPEAPSVGAEGFSAVVPPAPTA